ncbi:hypothetical protein, partial [Proteus hauseri]|uniref:hypothetical protein n=1 Tax=Proteus hauseri TaxID=183417 RepID=UPI000A5DA92C
NNIQSEVTGASITDDPNYHIYDKINYDVLDLIRNINELESENNLVTVNPIYSDVIDLTDEGIYS